MTARIFLEGYRRRFVAACVAAACLVTGGVFPAWTSTPLGKVIGYRPSFSQSPSGLAVVPNSHIAYVTTIRGGVTIINTNENTVIGDVKNYDGYMPIFIAASPDGSVAAVLDRFQAMIYIIDTQTNTATPVSFANPPDPDVGYFNSITFSPDSNTAYASGYGPVITIIDVKNKKANGTIPISTSGGFIANSPTENKAYFAPGDGTSGVTVIDTKTNTQAGMVKDLEKYIPGFSPDIVAFSPDGKVAYIGGGFGNGYPVIVVVDVATNTATGTIDIDQEVECSWGLPPLWDVVFAPDGKTAFAALTHTECVSRSGGDAVVVIDTTTNTAKGVIPGLSSGTAMTGWSLGTTNLTVSQDSKRLFHTIDENTYDSEFIAVADLVPAAPQMVLPSTGGVVGGTNVAITGTNLLQTTEVDFGGQPGTDLEVVSDTEITVTTPSHTVGPVDVTVVNLGGNATVTGAYTYITEVALSDVLTITDPFQGTTVTIPYTIAGTGNAGATVTVHGAASDPIDAPVEPDGTWSTKVEAGAFDGAVSITAKQSTGGEARLSYKSVYDAGSTHSLVVVENPQENAVLPAGTTEVTMSGTGQPGAKIVISTLSSVGFGPPGCTTTVESEGANKGQWSCDIKSLSTGLKYVSAVIQSEQGQKTGQGWHDRPVWRHYSVGTAEAE